MWAESCKHGSYFSTFVTIQSIRSMSEELAPVSLLFLVSNWFMAYCGLRPLVNSLELTTTMLALAYWPGVSTRYALERGVTIRASEWTAVGLAGLSCSIRPTSAVLWVCLILVSIRDQQFKEAWAVVWRAFVLG